MEENKTLMPPKEQALETERDAKAEELESTFSYDGYQVVRKELFAHLRDPAIVIRKDSITFNTACISGLGSVPGECSGSSFTSIFFSICLKVNYLQELISIHLRATSSAAPFGIVFTLCRIPAQAL